MSLPASQHSRKPGTVHLVGAGPGDAGLLTIRAAELLAKADSVVYDRLCGYHFLSHVRPDVRLHNVGKRDSMHLVPQDEICALLVSEAEQGYNVVRLKGGDPYVFGRGGEEAEYLLERGIPFQVVPGISSGIAVPGAAGIPVTHRDFCTSFHVITGHLRSERGQGAYDFAALCALQGTLVFLMGVKNLPTIVSGLLAHGMDPQTPAAVVSKGFSAHQASVHAPVCQIVDALHKAHIEAPAITIIGAVTELGPILSAGSPRKRLQGRKVLVTRTRHQAGKLTELLRSEGAECLELPLLQTQYDLSAELWQPLLTELSATQWVVFTSENGVEAFFAGMRGQRVDLRSLASVKFAVVGSATAEALRKQGFMADVVPPQHSAEALAHALLPHLTPKTSVLIARAAVADPILPRMLAEAGIHVNEFALYSTHPDPRGQELLPTLLAEGDFDWIPFASSSAVEAFAQATAQQNQGLPANLRIACIGPSTQATAVRLGFQVSAVAAQATLADLVAALD